MHTHCHNVFLGIEGIMYVEGDIIVVTLHTLTYYYDLYEFITYIESHCLHLFQF